MTKTIYAVMRCDECPEDCEYFVIYVGDDYVKRCYEHHNQYLEEKQSQQKEKTK